MARRGSATSSATRRPISSFDVDALDPAFAPGTGTPEIGGLASWQAQAILRRLRGVAFVGMDVVEVAPAYDVGGNHRARGGDHGVGVPRACSVQR